MCWDVGTPPRLVEAKQKGVYTEPFLERQLCSVVMYYFHGRVEGTLLTRIVTFGVGH